MIGDMTGSTPIISWAEKSTRIHSALLSQNAVVICSRGKTLYNLSRAKDMLQLFHSASDVVTISDVLRNFLMIAGEGIRTTCFPEVYFN